MIALKAWNNLSMNKMLKENCCVSTDSCCNYIVVATINRDPYEANLWPVLFFISNKCAFNKLFCYKINFIPSLKKWIEIYKIFLISFCSEGHNIAAFIKQCSFVLVYVNNPLGG